MATPNAIEIPIANEPIDEASGPRHDSMDSNASTAVDNREGQAQQKENYHQSSVLGSYFPSFANVPQVLEHQNPAQGSGVLDTTVFHNRRVNDKMPWRQASSSLEVLNGREDVERPAGSSSPLAPSMTSATSLVKTPNRFYRRHRGSGNHLAAIQASSSSIPSQLEQGVSTAGEDSADDQNQTPPSSHGAEHQSPTHLGTPEIQSPSNHRTGENQSPMQPGALKVTRKQIRSEDRFSKLWYKIHVLVYDLRVCRSRPSNLGHGNRVLTLQERGSLLGAPYFDDQEVETLHSLQLPRRGFFTCEKITLWNFLRLRFGLDCSIRANQSGRSPPPDLKFRSMDSFLDSSENLGCFLQSVLKVKEKNLRNKIFLETMKGVGLDIENGQKWL